MLTLDDLSTFLLADGSLPGAYGVRLAPEFSGSAATAQFEGGIPSYAIAGHALRRLVASGIPVLAAWRVGALGEDLKHVALGDESLVLPQVGAPPIVFGDILAGLDELPKRRKRKKKGPPPPPAGVKVGAATSPGEPSEGAGVGTLPPVLSEGEGEALDAAADPSESPESGGDGG